MHVAIIGATGVLGRPVTRTLAADDRFHIRALVRDESRARAALPSNVDLIKADLHDPPSITSALQGADAVYLNLSHPPSRRTAYDPDRDGTRTVIEAAKAAGVKRVLRISALVVRDETDPWFVIQRKHETDREIMACGIDWTIFRPTWFMESIPMFLMGPFLVEPLAPRVPLRWIAGADYGRMVAAALARDDARNCLYTVQGPEPVTITDALKRFRAAYAKTCIRAPTLIFLMRLAGLVMAQAKYAVDLFDATFKQGDDFVSAGAFDLAEPTMTIEDYTHSIATTGDVPSKF